MLRDQTPEFVLRSCRSVLALLIFGVIGCSPDHQQLIDKADREALAQKGQLAKYLYLQVIQKRTEKDPIRFRALVGYAEVAMTQLREYEEAAKALRTVFDEYGTVIRYRPEIRELRLRASKLYRVNLERPNEALDALSPILESEGSKTDLAREAGKVYLQLNNYDEAKRWFLRAWESARGVSACSELRALQLDIMQVYSLKDQCDETLKWSEIVFPDGCQPDDVTLRMERANCLELKGSVSEAMAIYEQMIKQDPKNTRAYFFLNKLKQRQKDKAQK